MATWSYESPKEAVPSLSLESGPFSTRRNPWVITCERWHALGQYIAMPINPSDISWHIPLRIATEQTKGAHVTYVWRNNYLNVSIDGGIANPGTTLQDMELTITVNSANIAPMLSAAKQKQMMDEDPAGTLYSFMPNPAATASDLLQYDRYSAMANIMLTEAITSTADEAGLISDYDSTVPLGVQNLYRLLSLADEPKIYYKTNGSAATNRIAILANTPAFPKLRLYGEIQPSGITWDESSEHPNTFDATIHLLITEISPALGINALTELLSAYKMSLQNNEDVLNNWAGLTVVGSVRESTDSGDFTVSKDGVPSQVAGSETTTDATEQSASTEPNTATQDAESPTPAQKAMTAMVDNNLTKKQQAEAAKMSQADLDRAAAQATKNGTAAEKKKAQTIAQSPDYTPTEKAAMLVVLSKSTGSRYAKSREASRKPFTKSGSSV